MTAPLQIGITCLLSGILLSGCTLWQIQQAGPDLQALHAQAQQGDIDSQFRLGLRFYHGLEVPQNYPAAYDYFRKAAKQGHQQAQYLLGTGYYEGKGVSKQSEEACHWLEPLAKQGNLQAQYIVGMIFLEDTSTNKLADPAWGAYWLSKAALAGHSAAQYQLGLLHLKGKGVPKHLGDAYHWLMMAHQQKHPKAKQALTSLQRQLKTTPQVHRYQHALKSQAHKDFAAVQFVQFRLKQLGYPLKHVDGIWGRQTQHAIDKYSKKNQLPLPQKISPRLLQALRDNQQPTLQTITQDN
ncbi:SEL1-like repeat protein [Zooshikella harenae]|uniref:SEL1-like repeat protein n=1 Tax=Zooshikella harenae TaxID=2827238 RepID=A0ABS5ZF55_9GAMM|nr:SEL1-like repeat protein [Zooshikella harenae]MBU2712702.1 SEL1-like repeat protein [Zooshikella harenae]